jgi:hypothetical protein
MRIMFQLLAGVADATDWTYWSHLESLFKTMPSSTQTVIEGEDEEDSSHHFLKEVGTVCGVQTSLLLLIIA